MHTRLLALLVTAITVTFAFSNQSYAADVDVTQIGQKFIPGNITAKVGDHVKFHNKDDVTHNINVIDAADNADDKGLQKPGEDIDELLAKAGVYNVRCSIHPKMKMTINVQ